MNKILFIDDEPHLRVPLLKIPVESVCPAHGYNMVDYWLNHSGITFDLISVDNDMPLLAGTEVCRMFLMTQNTPVVIHTMNVVAGKQIKAMLDEYATPNIILPIITENWYAKVLEWKGSL